MVSMTQKLILMSQKEIDFFKKFHGVIEDNIRTKASLCHDINCFDCIICESDRICYKGSEALKPMLEHFLTHHKEALL